MQYLFHTIIFSGTKPRAWFTQSRNSDTELHPWFTDDPLEYTYPGERVN